MSQSSTDSVAASQNNGIASDEVRSSVYDRLSLAFSFPDASLHAQVKEGHLVERLTATLSRLPYRLKLSDLNWRAPDRHDEMESEYIRLFQIGGRRGPPCSIHSGFYGRDRSRTLQHLIRFYNFFGFGLGDSVMPDHICVELDFMALLARGDLADRESLLRAQRDFLNGQLRWTEEFASRVRSARPKPFYGSLADLTCRFVKSDRAFIEGAASVGVRYDRN